MPNNKDDQVGTQVFISYAHDDETVLNFVEKFAKDLQYYAFADHGREIQVFLDSQSIIWGEEWRTRLYESVKGASAFVPLVTMKYLDRPMCREELQLFVESAQNIGVTELFLPIVVLGHRHITEDSENLATRHVATRQYIDLKDAVLDGTTSSTWRKALVGIAARLIEGIERAEESLVKKAEQLTPEADEPKPPEGVDSRPDDAPGIDEIYEVAIDNINKVGPLLLSLTEILNEFKAKTDKLQEDIRKTGKESAPKILLRFAKEFSPRSLEAESIGNELEQSSTAADQSLREVHAILARYGHEQMKAAFAADINSTIETMKIIEEAGARAREALEASTAIEVLNVPVRKALRPLRNGLNSTNAAFSTMLSWRELGKF